MRPRAHHRPGLLAGAICAVIVALGADRAPAATVQDLVRLKGHEWNTLTGLGIVIGLDGTGDSSDDSYVTARPYAQLLKNLDDPVLSLEELAEADAYAIVEVSLEVPPTGAREGDRLDVRVHTLFNATSLDGGRLVVSLLYPPVPIEMRGRSLAMAGGSVVIEGDNPRAGLVRRGGQILDDHAFRPSPVTPEGFVELVIKEQYAGYPVATTIANAVNDEFFASGAEIAAVQNANTVVVRVPEADRARPAAFVATLMTLQIDASLIQTEARIVINERQGIITFTGNVEVGPVGITHRGLSITTITPPPPATPDNPQVETTSWAGLDTSALKGRNAARLEGLLEAFEQIKVPVEDQIAIIHELRKTGALHAEIVTP